MLRCPAILKAAQNDASDVFEESQLSDKNLGISNDLDMILLSGAAKQYLKIPDRPEDDLSVHAFYKAGALYVSSPDVLFTEICCINQYSIAFSRFKGFPDCKLTQSRYFKSKIRVLEMFLT